MKELENQLILIQKQGEVNTRVLLELTVTQETIIRESAVLKRNLQELKDADPQVKNYLNTPIPDNLRGLYQGSSSTSGTFPLTPQGSTAP